MLNKGFSGHVSELLNCSLDHIPDSAARFLLGTRRQLKADHLGYRSIDDLFERALTRFFVEINNVNSQQATYLGRLYTRPGGFVLKIRRDISETKYRFVRAHELAHILAYEKTDDEPRRRFANSSAEEKLCNKIATHLLLPEDLVASRFERMAWLSDKFDVSELTRFSDDYRVTPWLAVRRAMDRDVSNAENTVAVLWRKESNDVFRVWDSIAPPGVYVPRNDRSFRNGTTNQVIWKTIRSLDTIIDVDNVGLGSLKGCLKSLSFAYLGSFPAVVQILTLDGPNIAKSSKWRETRYLNPQRKARSQAINTPNAKV